MRRMSEFSVKSAINRTTRKITLHSIHRKLDKLAKAINLTKQTKTVKNGNPVNARL